MVRSPTPAPVRRALAGIGADLATWRKLRQLTAAQVADRAGVSRSVVTNLENGSGASLENTLRVARALGVLDSLVGALDPYSTDVGRLRSNERLPQRVRTSRPRPPAWTEGRSTSQSDDGG
ncbi:MAG: helix-turn-helix transcriptional regulator [Jatrophihabitantaceae bacterium]